MLTHTPTAAPARSQKRAGRLMLTACLAVGVLSGTFHLGGESIAAAQSSFGSSNAPWQSFRPAPAPKPAPQPQPAPAPKDPAPQPLPKLPQMPPVQDPAQPEQQPKVIEKITKVPIFSREENIEWHEVGGQKIYAEGEAFQFLENPGKITPGARITNTRLGSYCSVGWIVEKNGEQFILTAGHCGREGDVFSMEDPEGRQSVVGTMTYSEFQNHGDIGRYDKGLIKIDNPAMVDARVQLFWKNQQMTTATVQDTNWTEEHKPRLCRMGARTGLSCGPYYGLGADGQLIYNAISLPGDSGGPVFATHNGNVFPVGIVSGGLKEDAIHQVTQPIAQFLNDGGYRLL